MKERNRKRYFNQMISLVLCISFLIAGLPVKAESYAEERKVTGAVYYVDDKNGDDGNDGISPETAWRSLKKVNATTFHAGDKLLLKRGGVFTGQLSPKGSGAEGNPIIIASYGEGARPLIQGNSLIKNDDAHPENQQFNAAVYFYNQEYWEITELEITNMDPDGSDDEPKTDENKKYGVLIMGHDAGTLRHMYCRDLYVHHVVTIPEGRQAGIGRGGIIYAIRGNKRKTSWDDIVIENNQVGPSVNHYGINFLSTWGSSIFPAESGIPQSEAGGERVNSTNIVIRNNYCVDIGNAAICPTAYENVLIENNVCDTCNSGPNGNVPIWWENGNYTITQKNEVFHSGATPGKEDSQAFDADVNARLNYVQYNYTHDNPSGAYFECALGTQYTTHFRYNISQNDGAGENSYGQGSIITLGGSSGNPASKLYIYNNTMYLKEFEGRPCKSYVLRTWGETFNRDNPENFQFTNNVVINDGESLGYHYNANDEVPSITGIFSNNAYGGTNVDGVKPPAGRAETDSLVYGEDGVTDPYFGLKAPGQGGTSGVGSDGFGVIEDRTALAACYQLKDEQSPLIGKGTLMPENGGVDYWNNPVSSVNAPNIGADNRFADMSAEPGAPGDGSILSFDDLAVGEGSSRPLSDFYEHCNFGQGMWNVSNTAGYGTELYANHLSNEQQVCKIALPEGIILKGFKARTGKNNGIIKVIAGEEERSFSIGAAKQEYQTGFQGAGEAVYFIPTSASNITDIKLDDLILQAPEGGIKNVALHKPATANGTSQNDPSFAVDGDESSLWIRDLYAGNDGDHWLQIDLKKEYQINGFEAVFENDTTEGHNWQYKIEGSLTEDFSNPVMLSDQTATLSTAKKQILSCDSGDSFRYVRLTITQLGGTDDPWPAIAELKVMADTNTYQNAALHKPSEQNAQDTNYGKPAANINDGDPSTLGGSLNIAAGEGGGQYIWTIDFEEQKHINRTEIVFAPKGSDIPDPDNKWIPDWRYKIEYSADKENWSVLADYTQDPLSNPNKENLTQTETCNLDCRYMRVTITGGPTVYPASWAVIAEFSAFSPIKSVEGADAVEPGQIVNHNLAYGKPVIASDNAPEAAMITDKDAQTGFIPEADGNAVIDFGKIYRFDEFRLQFEDGASEKQFKLKVSADRENWTPVSDQLGGADALQIVKESGTGRYLKIEFSKTPQKLMKLEAYGTEADRERRKIMVIVPHEDDEVLASGGIIKDATLNGDDILVVIGTNGDYNGTAAGKNRIGESIAALTNLDVRPEDMIFMGYADNGGLIGRWGQEADHSQIYQMYMAADENKLIPGRNGTEETYGQDLPGKQDYHYEYTNTHAKYTRKNFLEDLMHAIREFGPTDIYCTSMYDMHSDHAYINLFVREAILKLQKEDKTFQPTLWDGIVHSVAGDTDLGGSDNWPAHGQDVTKAMEKPNNLEEATTFDWNRRVSVTVPYQMRQAAPLKYSLKEQTLRLYGSQYMDLFISDFSRYDEVFWEKPFTSVAYRANATSSSNQDKAQSVIDGIESGYIPAMEKLDFTQSAKKKRDGFPHAEWIANATKGEWIQLEWDNPQAVNKIVLYDRPDPSQNITSGKLTFDDGTTQDVGELPANGRPYEIAWEEAKTIRSLRFEITGVSEGTDKPGLAEIEVYGEKAVLDKTPLQELIIKAKAIENKDNQYTEESYEALQNAIARADEGFAAIDSEKQLKQMLEELQAAIDSLVKENPAQLDKTPLKELIQKAKAIDNKNNRYTQKSFEALKLAIAKAEERLAAVNSEKLLKEAVEELQKAMDSLVKINYGGSSGEEQKDEIQKTTQVRDPETGEIIGEKTTITQKDAETGAKIKTTIEKNKVGAIVDGKIELETAVSQEEIVDDTANLRIVVPEKAIAENIKKGAANIFIQIPIEEMSIQSKNSKIKNIKLELKIPQKVIENEKADIQEIILKKEAILQSRAGNKNITVSVQNETGKEYYIWNFGNQQLSKEYQIQDVNLSMGVYSIKDMTYIEKSLKKDANKEQGLVFNFKHSGKLPGPADLKVYLGDNERWNAGKIGYLYYYNDKKDKLTELYNNQYRIDEEGYVDLRLEHCSDYALLPSKPSDKTIITLLDQVSAPKKLTLKAGKTTTLKVKNLSNADLTKVCKSSKKSVARVSKAGYIKAVKKGKAVIITKVTINGKTKTLKTKVTVK